MVIQRRQEGVACALPCSPVRLALSLLPVSEEATSESTRVSVCPSRLFPSLFSLESIPFELRKRSPLMRSISSCLLMLDAYSCLLVLTRATPPAACACMMAHAHLLMCHLPVFYFLPSFVYIVSSWYNAIRIPPYHAILCHDVCKREFELAKFHLLP